MLLSTGCVKVEFTEPDWFTITTWPIYYISLWMGMYWTCDVLISLHNPNHLQLSCHATWAIVSASWKQYVLKRDFHIWHRSISKCTGICHIFIHVKHTLEMLSLSPFFFFLSHQPPLSDIQISAHASQRQISAFCRQMVWILNIYI